MVHTLIYTISTLSCKLFWLSWAQKQAIYDSQSSSNLCLWGLCNFSECVNMSTYVYTYASISVRTLRVKHEKLEFV